MRLLTQTQSELRSSYFKVKEMRFEFKPSNVKEQKAYDKELELEKVLRYHTYIGRNSRAQELVTECNTLWKEAFKK